MSKSIVRGNSLMLFYNGKSLGFATAHTLSVSADTVDISTKDGGYWASSDIGNMSWEITTENLYSTTTEGDASDSDYNILFDLMLAKTPVDIVWGIATDYDANGLGEKEAWTAPTTGGYKGKAVITSLSVNANTGENATYSCTFTGYGAIAKQA